MAFCVRLLSLDVIKVLEGSLEDGSFTWPVCWCWLTAGNSVRDLGQGSQLLSIGALLWAAWASLWHGGWVLRVNILRESGRSFSHFMT